MPYPVAFRKICGNQITRAEKERWLDSLPRGNGKKWSRTGTQEGAFLSSWRPGYPGTDVH